MSKERRTVSLEPEVNDFLQEEGVNASQLVNKLVKNHATSGGDTRSMLELRAEQLRSDINELHGRVESKEDELERVESRLDEFRTEREKVLDEAAEALHGTTLEEDNPAVQNWAEQADVPVDELISEVEDRRDSP